MKEEFDLSKERKAPFDCIPNNKSFYFYPEEDVKEFIKRLKEELENDKYTDDEYPAKQSFIKVSKATKWDDDYCISKIIDKLAGEKLK